jgi:hypothetical protein
MFQKFKTTRRKTMDGLSFKLTKGDRRALALAKTFVTTPTLINSDLRQGAVQAIPLEAEVNQKRASAEVSESLVISTDSKKYIADNVAPGPKSWQLNGYIKGNSLLEPTNYYQPFVQLNTDILWSWFDHGAVLTFRDGNAQIHKRVVIKDFQTAQQKDSANATPFTMTLKEINVMETSLADLPDNLAGEANKLIKSIPVIGSAIGGPLSLGMTAAETILQIA